MCFEKSIKLYPFEKLTVYYTIFTSILILILWDKLEQPITQILGRALILVGLVGVSLLSDKYLKNDRPSTLIRILLQIGLLPFWYPDIYEFNKVFPNLDHFFVALEQNIFGFQPAIEFSKKLPFIWFSEAVYFGYFAYYPMIVGSVLYSFFVKQEELQRLMYIIMGAFFSFYLVFIFLPVAGPQFYYLAIGMENVFDSNFYEIGDYFKDQFEIMKGPGFFDGLFYQGVEMVQSGGERPIAAFPSSHVGISTVIMLWAKSVNNKLTIILFPVYILLCCATVYIQAHYLIDVFAGWIVGVLFFYLFNKLYMLRS